MIPQISPATIAPIRRPNPSQTYSLARSSALRLFHNLTMKSLLTLLIVATLGTIVSADAKTFKLPNDDFAIASIDMPDSWKPKEAENGVFGESADGAVYLSVVAVGSDKGIEAEIDDTFDMLKTHKVVLDESTKKENKFKVGGFDATELLYQGKDEDGPAAISIVFVPIKDKLIIMTYWVTTAKEKEHLQEVGKIVNSLKASS
ncbi:MAG TPA: PsbP-related protein [Verrucomicrobiae bacterium]|nr:PsbP-related protein [Verrucomicrobiae bacterium]